ncbi:beta-phosphoglucomutase [Salipaludibacillus sp. LMS25]|uniref:beta-phosphoglucomutase n=1 Tax=Salipaludibacillus sp. LMS25 TaxID=2924031 RepID=UPI0020D0201D|nr:beta-phosphoglucomutase [Salipaludibacillus sp. LMS25]UTR15934.1 beta-phosphoglucomutase [Salipaludibacillus sp. LMS25]
MRTRGLIFDLDGVIVDTAKYHYLAWKEIAKELGINLTLEDNECLKGVSRTKSFEIILEIGGVIITKESFQKYCEWKNEIYISYIQDMTNDDVLPGVKEFLIESKKKEYSLAIGSASKNAMLILEKLHLTSIFDVIIDGNRVSKAKPNSEVFIKGAEEMGLAYEDCIVFEDATAGVEAAHNCGMRAIGIGSKGALPNADLVIDSFVNINIEFINQKLETN